MIAPPVISPSRNGGWSSDRLSTLVVRPLVSTTMIEKIIVVAPTTAVPMSTGLAVALNVLPAPSFSSRKCLARSKFERRSRTRCLSCVLDARDLLDQRQLVHRLRVVGHRTVRVDGDRHRAHAEEAERDEAEREHGRGDHQRADAREDVLTQYAIAISDHDRHAEPVRAEVAGDEARENVERRAALARRGHDFLACAATRSR